MIMHLVTLSFFFFFSVSGVHCLILFSAFVAIHQEFITFSPLQKYSWKCTALHSPPSRGKFTLIPSLLSLNMHKAIMYMFNNFLCSPYKDLSMCVLCLYCFSSFLFSKCMEKLYVCFLLVMWVVFFFPLLGDL